MSNPIIKVNNLSKRYRIGAAEKGYKTFREAIVEGISAPVRNLARLQSLTKFKDGQEEDVIWALKDVSFEVDEKEVLGIIGRNGAGKTTLLKILSRITEPTSGFAEIQGRVSSLLEVGTGFHPELTGRENIFLNGAILGMRKKEIERKFDEVVDFSGVEKFIDTPLKRYSSGMQVRLAFSVAAHLEPEILLVDEVLAVGDAEFQKKCLGKMGDVAQGGRTVLFVSHNLEAVKRLCSRSILLDEGHKINEGSSEEVIRSYLSTGVECRAERVWKDINRSPGNNNVRLNAVRVIDSTGEVSSIVDIQEPVILEMEYTVLSSGHEFYFYYLVYNEDGVLLFTTVNNNEERWAGKAYPQGKYYSRCKIPANFLANGFCYVSVAASIKMIDFQFWENEAVSFEVNDTGGVRGAYQGGWRGVIRPMLEWKTQLQSGVN